MESDWELLCGRLLGEGMWCLERKGLAVSPAAAFLP